MTKPMRRLLYGLLGAFALLLLASFAVWRWAEGRMQLGFAAWTQAMAADGWSVHAGRMAGGGWPLAVDLSIDDFSMTGGARVVPGGAAFSAGRMTLRLDLLQPTVVSIVGEGQQSLRIGRTEAVPFTADRFIVTVPLTLDEPPNRAALDAGGLRFAAPVEGLTIGLLQGQAEWQRADAGTPPATSLRLSAEAITLPPPPAAQGPLGPHIASATIEGTMSGTLPADAHTPAAAAAGWRDSGGKLLLRDLALGWGPLGVSGSGSLTLDASLQPEVTATLRLIGMPETLSALAAAHVITPRAASAASAVSGLLAQAPEGGGTSGVQVPVTLHDGTLSLGMIPLATVGKLDWPNGE